MWKAGVGLKEIVFVLEFLLNIKFQHESMKNFGVLKGG